MDTKSEPPGENYHNAGDHHSINEDDQVTVNSAQIAKTTSVNLAPFQIEEIEKAIEQSNFSKAIGDDGFDGTILSLYPEARDKILKELTEIMNSQDIPSYFKRGRLVPMSKKSGQDTVNLDDIRPIIVRSHLVKIIEKTLINRV